MSRRKQSNPKPLLKSDCQESVDEMTAERGDCQESVDEMTAERENKDFSNNESINEKPPPGGGGGGEKKSKEEHMDVDSCDQLSPESTSIKDEDDDDRSSSSSQQSASKNIESPSSTIPDTSESQERQKNSSVAASTEITVAIPKVRLNISLASDPALKPDAKNITIIDNDDDENDDDDMDNENSSSNPNETSRYNNNNNRKKSDADDESVLSINKIMKSSSNLAGRSNSLNTSVIAIGQVTAKPSSSNSDITTTSSAVVTQRLKVFMCHPCGIGFSSHSTLEAHQKYYCSHRQEIEEDIPSANNVLISNTDKSSSGEPSIKSIKTGKQYACTQCSYSADKKVSLNRHMRMHQSSPAPSSNTSNGGEEISSQQIDRYCSECDIRFSNVKTYRAHKQHYCSSRRTEGQTPPKTDLKKSGSVSPQGRRSKTPNTASVAPPQPFLALPTNPILIIPYSIVRTASLLPGPLTSVTSGISNPDSTCFLFENGSLHPVATALNSQLLTESSTSRIHQQQSSQGSTVGALLSEKNLRNLNNVPPSTKTVTSTTTAPSKKEGSSRETVPLDLSVRRSPISFHKSSLDMMATIGRISTSSSSEESNRLDIEAMMEGKENLSILGSGKLTPEQIVCSPSLPSSPSLSPSPPKRKAALSPRVISSISSPPPLQLNCLNSENNTSNTSSTHGVHIRQMLPADVTLKLAEANAISPLLSKQQIELALKLASKPNEVSNTNVAVVAAAAAVATASATPTSPLLSIPPPINPVNVVPSIPNVQPQIYVKQGVSKCKECNIVFCKFENYLAHKQHYCSARNQDESGEIKVNTPPSIANNTNDSTAPPPVAYHQLICAACGIKYTSLDNLRAHQTFYCPKGGDLSSVVTAPSVSATVTTNNITNSTSNNNIIQIPVGKEKCGKCKTTHELNRPCPTINNNNNNNHHHSQSLSYKCPVCGFVTSNASDSRKHLETHGSIKAFRCSICRYKGNTLRGMRTHIRMHFDKKTLDFNEENYMSCILEEDGVEISSTVTTNQDQNSQQQQFNCEVCNYSSSYKGNVLRHMKLVHSQPATGGTPSTSPEVVENDEILSQNSDSINNKITSNESIIIKSEPIDIRTTDKELQDEENIPSTRIKIEPPDSDTLNKRSPLLSYSPQPQPLGILSHQSERNLTEKPTTIVASSNNDNSKYCKNCDIKFNYTDTYIAHKQFYCKSKQLQQQQQHQQQIIEIKTPSPVPNVQSTPPSPTSSLTNLGSNNNNNNKNKENVEAIL